MKALNEKYLLKRCTRDIVPHVITTRRKQPYRAPDARSFMTGAGHAYIEELLSAARIQRTGLFNPLAVRKLVEKHKSGRAVGAKDNMALVGILSSELVVDSFVNNFRGKARYAA